MDQLSDTQKAEIQEIFQLYDEDGSGSIDSSEMRNAMKQLGSNPTD